MSIVQRVYYSFQQELIQYLEKNSLRPESLAASDLHTIVSEPLLTLLDVTQSLERLRRKKYPHYGLQTAQAVIQELRTLEHLERILRELLRSQKIQPGQYMENSA